MRNVGIVESPAIEERQYDTGNKIPVADGAISKFGGDGQAVYWVPYDVTVPQVELLLREIGGIKWDWDSIPYERKEHLKLLYGIYGRSDNPGIAFLLERIYGSHL
jgi:hypothetical protein